MNLEQYNADKNRIAELESENLKLKIKLVASQKLKSKYKSAYKKAVSRLADADPRHSSNRKRSAIKMLSNNPNKKSIPDLIKSVAEKYFLSTGSVREYYRSEVAIKLNDDD